MRAKPLAFLFAFVSVFAQQESVQSLLTRAFELSSQGKGRTAIPLFQQALERASLDGNAAGQAAALRGIGAVHNAMANYTLAREYLNRSIELCARQTADRACLPHAQNSLAYTEWASGNRAAAARLYQDALGGFESAGATSQIPLALYNIAFLSDADERLNQGRLARALDSANAASNRRLAGKVHHLWGDTLYGVGDLRGAVQHLETALPLLDGPADRPDRARVLISYGRLFSVHLRADLALPYFEQALAVQRELDDQQGVVYSLGSLAQAWRVLGDIDRAITHANEALVIARATGSKSLISSAMGSLARLYDAKGLHAQALEMTKESLALSPDLDGTRTIQLAKILAALKRNLESLNTARHAISLASRHDRALNLAHGHYVAALALDATGKPEAAAADIAKALVIKEELRAKIIPTDALKRGYGDLDAGMFNFAIDLFTRLGQKERALAAAEQARARAFIDLLASRSLKEKAETAQSAASGTETPSPPSEEPHLISLSAVPAPSVDTIRLNAVQSNQSTLVYWVAPNAVFGWLVSPSGAIESFRSPIKLAELERLIAAATALASANRRQALSSLHKLLIQPLAAQLAQPASRRLNIVAHGPLHRLSFACLLDPRGRYLIESHQIAYTPSAATGGVFSSSSSIPPTRLLIVADPSPGTGLPALPGARLESASITKAARNRQVTVLAGSDAVESAVRRNLPSNGTIHFATHGVLVDDRPFDSFLALAGSPSRTKSTATASREPTSLVRSASDLSDSMLPSSPADGRLTIREIYDLRLDQPLVVLSACRTAAGPITGDGLAGLSRAFFYAGARTLVATLWDVADAPTQRLISRFYHHYLRGLPPGDALHAAQLEQLSRLRRGQVSANTPVGAIVLDEDPIYWAGFVLLRSAEMPSIVPIHPVHAH